jgi:hypothetical protein
MAAKITIWLEIQSTKTLEKFWKVLSLLILID